MAPVKRNKTGLSYDVKTARVKAALEKKETDIRAMLDRLAALVEFVQKAVMEEMLTGEGSKGTHAPMDVVKKLQMTAATAEVVSRASINLAKAEKLLAGRMTQEQVLEASKKKILSLPYGERSKVLEELLAAHQGQKTGLDPTAGFKDQALNQLLRTLNGDSTGK